ncbi:Hypothetical_protein [Hexamita inflata]|uniref:Hypothetical_protein n=1 Tax=Hexamita inflata TaxID=28002 RepID=A0AA86Q1L7_9EUKA|nr:Hypothetical protein HINF_LOCUS32347 [Hexamita inflata]
MSEIQNVNKSLISLQSQSESQFSNLSNDIQRVNNSANQQLNILNNQLLQTITNLNTTFKQQLDSQKQQIISVNSTMYNMNNQLTTTLNQVNQYLQNQIDGAKNDIRTIQSSITGINGIINNINNVNAVQSADIQTLKNQQAPIMNGVFWCSMQKNIYTQITGYCSNSKQCCYVGRVFSNYRKACLTSNIINTDTPSATAYYQYVSDNQCGTFINV